MVEKSLPAKIARSEEILQPYLENSVKEVAVAWTGGKDSTVLLALWRALLDHAGLGPLRAITVDTGVKFPEVIAFRTELAKRWGVELHVARPEVDTAAYPVARDPLECCRTLKVEPLMRAIERTGTRVLLSGIRRDEHPDRKGREPVEPRTDPDHILVNPLLDWTETDVWASHDLLGIPYCSLYAMGYRSLGCMPCTAFSSVGPERAGRASAKEQVLRDLTALGYF
ncbi:phosphoadenosine phosphosulfate reductase family protein [Salidesulfovibrio brasiliensis]|uniref:phosphoadenosine phosphosulfate reductase family protein n=1 Tax=Salidesulfovibrio brasiliensis TaxID=221711 RepID=UPI0006D248F7|nr:phosphoadenosine phosphosulfate reductase family protein [Salidesulfovibrio brasiliensis]